VAGGTKSDGGMDAGFRFDHQVNAYSNDLAV
jgi:hypothetical protein